MDAISVPYPLKGLLSPFCICWHNLCLVNVTFKDYTMKKTIQIFSMLLIAMTIMVSCKKDKDPATTDFFIGTYKGPISYKKGDTNISRSDGKITVSKVGDTYNFYFGSDIPDIKGVRFEKSGDNSYVSVGSGLTGITIDASKLKMLVIRDGATWTADCNR